MSASSLLLPRGTVVTVRFPFSDQSSAKYRPAISISDPNHVTGDDGHFMFIGSNEPPWPEPSIEVKRGSREAIKMGLRFERGKDASYIRPHKVATIERSLVNAKLGIVPPGLLAEVTRVLGEALGA